MQRDLVCIFVYEYFQLLEAFFSEDNAAKALVAQVQEIAHRTDEAAVREYDTFLLVLY